MVQLHQPDLKHVQFLLAELEAELMALRAADQAVLALAQLDEREANGQPLVAVCGAQLRTALELQIAQSPVTAGLAGLKDLADAVAGRNAARKVTSADHDHSVIDLAERRRTAKPSATSAQTRSMRRYGHAIAVSLTLTVLTSVGLSWLPALGRLPIIDIAGGASSLVYPTQRLAASDRL